MYSARQDALLLNRKYTSGALSLLLVFMGYQAYRHEALKHSQAKPAIVQKQAARPIQPTLYNLPPRVAKVYTPAPAGAPIVATHSRPLPKALVPTQSFHFSPKAELHVIGVYESLRLVGDYSCGKANISKCRRLLNSRDNNPQGMISVNITRQQNPIILVLMAYEPMVWDISVGEGVKIEQVILGGYYGQTVTSLPNNIPVSAYSHYSSDCENCWQSNDYFYAYELKDDKFAKKLYSLTGKRMSSFQGMYHGDFFHISDHMPKLVYNDR